MALWQDGSDTEIVLMVTHGVEEAVLLSDRIVVMGPDPGPSVIDQIVVPLLRPRTNDMVALDPAGRSTIRRILMLLGAPVGEDVPVTEEPLVVGAGV